MTFTDPWDQLDYFMNEKFEAQRDLVIFSPKVIECSSRWPWKFKCLKHNRPPQKPWHSTVVKMLKDYKYIYELELEK